MICGDIVAHGGRAHEVRCILGDYARIHARINGQVARQWHYALVSDLTPWADYLAAKQAAREAEKQRTAEEREAKTALAKDAHAAFLAKVRDQVRRCGYFAQNCSKYNRRMMREAGCDYDRSKRCWYVMADKSDCNNDNNERAQT